MPETTDLIYTVKVLHGHENEDTAYLVDDYPYGRQLRCEIRYWVDTALTGAKTGEQRFVSQTTNPKRPTRVWNNPKRSTYSSLVVMYLNEKEHVSSWHIDANHVTPEGDAALRLFGVYEQLTEEQRARYDTWVQRSKRYTPPWKAWDEALLDLCGYIEEYDDVPTLDGNVWVDEDGRRRHLGMTERDHAIYFASARALFGEI